MNEFVRAFVLLLAVIDPIGAIPVFLDSTRTFDQEVRRKVAIRGTILATFILIGFIIIGQLLIEAMHISLPAFQVAGGLILFLFALTMVFGNGHGSATSETAINPKHVTVFPIAMPAIASPGAITAVVLLTDNHLYTIGQQAITSLLVLLIMGITMLLLLAAGSIRDKIGTTGISVISRIMGFLLAAIAMESVLAGLKLYFN